jgi:hypothetical protein
MIFNLSNLHESRLHAVHLTVSHTALSEYEENSKEYWICFTSLKNNTVTLFMEGGNQVQNP